MRVKSISPQKSSYSYHFYTSITVIFYIISGKGKLETPDGDKDVTKGDVIVFPPRKQGAHRITNISELDMLVYLNCDTTSMADVAFYLHSGKIGFIIDSQLNTFFELTDKVDYYKGE